MSGGVRDEADAVIGAAKSIARPPVNDSEGEEPSAGRGSPVCHVHRLPGLRRSRGSRSFGVWACVSSHLIEWRRAAGISDVHQCPMFCHWHPVSWGTW